MSFQKDGSLALDSGKLSQALASDPAGVARLFASGGAASDSLVKVVGSGTATSAGQLWRGDHVSSPLAASWSGLPPPR